MSKKKRPARKQTQIAISEFFEKNKHFLGFDTLQRSIITAVKEAVDNSLDACEERTRAHPKGILPEIRIMIKRMKGDQIRLIAQDNGPGIPRGSIEHVFGKFLLGSRFHAIRQTRGQQGIGITGVVMYSQLTTGAKTRVISKVKGDSGAVHVDLGIDTRRNKAIKTREERKPWEDELTGEYVQNGLRIETVMKAKYQRGKQSVYQYLRMTSIVNPHATVSLTVLDRDGDIIEEGYWERSANEMPDEVVEIYPHPHGMELGTLQRMLRETDESDMIGFLTNSFSSVTENAAKRILEKADLDESRQPRRIKSHDAQALVDCFQKVKLINPPTDCLSPIEDLLIKKGLSKAIDSRFVSTITRKPLVTQGNPYQIEAGLVFGGDLNSDSPIEILRFANRVPLMYQQGGCMLTKAVESVDWKRYGLDQPGGRGIPKGPAALLIHLASTNVQFTSEAKEAVAVNEEVMNEIRKALLKMGQGLRGHLKKSTQRKKAQEKFELINVILPEISKKSSQILGREEPNLAPVITQIMNAVFCEEEVGWDSERKLATCDITIFNYTARARAYTILAKWPEGGSVQIEDNPRGGRKEAFGLWAWRLDTLDPGSSATISFSVSGLSKGSWNDTEIFFRGKRDIVGANRIDEKLLEEMRKQEVVAEGEAVDTALKGVIDRKDEIVSRSSELETKQMTLQLGYGNEEELE